MLGASSVAAQKGSLCGGVLAQDGLPLLPVRRQPRRALQQASRRIQVRLSPLWRNLPA